MKDRFGIRRAHARKRRLVGNVPNDCLYFEIFCRRRKTPVQQRQTRNSLPAELATGKQCLCELEAEEAAAAGEENFHAAILAKNASTSASSRVCFMGGRLARIVRPYERE